MGLSNVHKPRGARVRDGMPTREDTRPSGQGRTGGLPPPTTPYLSM